jgi:hypothetical protein
MITSAIALRDSHEAFYRAAKETKDPDDFRRQYLAFLTEVQELL